MLGIYPTTRAIRQERSRLATEDMILPKAVTIGEFEKKALFVPDKVFLDEDKRVLLLRKAADFENFKDLKIDREYLSFLKNSKILFSFFEELANEKVNIEELELADTYAEYADHLDILKKLLCNYEKILQENGYVDKIFVPKEYVLNEDYLQDVKEATLHIEGYLSNFEFDLFLEISETIPLFIKYAATEFNRKMSEKFKVLDMECEDGYKYIIDLSNKKILSKEKIEQERFDIDLFAAKDRVIQCAFVKKKVYDFIKKGIDPEKIVIITPSEDFARILENFDEENNFNFAMGFSFKKSVIYKRIDAVHSYFKDKNFENLHRLQRLGYDENSANELTSSFSKKCSKNESLEFFRSFINQSDKQSEVEVYEKQLYLFEKIEDALKEYPLKAKADLFLSRLSKSSIDDVRGGKITVMGVLESRAVDFDGVVVVDFNEDTVPKKSQKDLFLSSDIRKKANLPTSFDRENLQKSYFEALLRRAKFAAISYVEDELNQSSRFLDQLEIKPVEEKKSATRLDEVLFSSCKQKEHYHLEDLFLEHDFTQTTISSTMLKTYLDCKRKYYFKYIKNIKEAQIPKEEDEERNVGILLHESLKEVFFFENSIFDEDKLLQEIKKRLYQKTKEASLLRLKTDIWLERLSLFVKNEVQRFKQGYKVVAVEKSIRADFEGFKIKGDIDRIDEKEGKLSVIDYKSGKINFPNNKNIDKFTDFQLEFYYLLASREKEVEDVYFYDLKEGRLTQEKFFEQKMLLLRKKFELLKEKKQNFSMSEDLDKCRYCPYAIICQRSL